MSRDRRKPPPTGNTLARRLIASAQTNCQGCRTDWRLESNAFRHPVPGGYVECWAPNQRMALRSIAAKGHKI